MLKQGDTDALLAVADSKNALAGALAALSQARESELARLGLPKGRGGMETWLERFGRADDQGVWSNWLQLANEARELNTLNGKLIGLHMQHNQQALTALMSATNRAMTYGPDGQQQTGLGGRILGTA